MACTWYTPSDPPMTAALPLRWLTLEIPSIFLAAPNKPKPSPSTPPTKAENVEGMGGSATSASDAPAQKVGTHPAPPSPEEPVPVEPVEADDVRAHIVRLVGRTKKGDREAYKELVERYQKRVFGIVYGMLHSREDAMELTQEVFIKVYQRIGEFEEKSSFYTWVYRISVNLAIDFRRREWKKVHTEYDDSMPDQGLDDGVFQRERRNPEQMSQDRELGESISSALETLPDEQRAVLIMREVDGMAYQEMADVMGCSIGTIMSRLFYARKKMQTALKNLKQPT